MARSLARSFFEFPQLKQKLKGNRICCCATQSACKSCTAMLPRVWHSGLLFGRVLTILAYHMLDAWLAAGPGGCSPGLALNPLQSKECTSAISTRVPARAQQHFVRAPLCSSSVGVLSLHAVQCRRPCMRVGVLDGCKSSAWYMRACLLQALVRCALCSYHALHF